MKQKQLKEFSDKIHLINEIVRKISIFFYQSDFTNNIIPQINELFENDFWDEYLSENAVECLAKRDIINAFLFLYFSGQRNDDLTIGNNKNN